MNIAFLNLCHCDSDLVCRAANKLTQNPNFDMYIHVDAKTQISPFQEKLCNNQQVFFLQNRKKVFWGGYHAVEATFELLREALKSEKKYEYFVLLQNLDYPIRSNKEIEDYFVQKNGVEFLRGCNIARTKDWHYSKKYKIYNRRDDVFYLTKHAKFRMYLHYLKNAIYSVSTIASTGVIKDSGGRFQIHYGAAQWGITRAFASYLLEFERTHPKFNERMKKIQFPDEEYFHTVLHNSSFKTNCIAFDEPEKRWLVNWRNLHYFEFPREVSVFEEKDFDQIIKQDALFIRKVRTGISDRLLDRIDAVTMDD